MEFDFNTVVWRKASKSYDWKNLKCVELGLLPDGMIACRSTERIYEPPVTFTKTELRVFFDGVKAGEFDDLVS